MPRKTNKELRNEISSQRHRAYLSDGQPNRIRRFLEELPDGDSVKELYEPIMQWEYPKDVITKYSKRSKGAVEYAARKKKERKKRRQQRRRG